ncbi:MAG TPA: helix-turn-helix transcriptional regulator [Planctomycetota bacterium]|nr:helix-turn-helix transcriptional regulator [Planctomycetota bacterium]
MGQAAKDRTWTGAGVHFVTAWRHKVAPGRCGLHGHREWELVYHAAGRGRSSLEDGPGFEFEPGSAELYPAGLRHDQENVAAGEDLCVHFEWLPPRGESLPGWVRAARLADACLLHEMEALAAERPGTGPLRGAVANHRCAALLLGVLRDAAAAPAPRGPGEDHARRAYEHIREHCCTMGSVEEAAAAAGIGPDHLRHVFRSHFRMSPKAWLIEARIRRAQSLLASSALPLKEVARLCGFENQRYFSTSFRRAVGRPPGAYRGSLAR